MSRPLSARRILVVDDDPAVVNAVELELSNPPLGHYHYEVEGFICPKKALKRARRVKFDAVICDFCMPEMDGLAFLRVFRDLQPDCIRLVLSGYADIKALVAMVNETHIYHFIRKPWHDYYLKSALAQALDHAKAANEIKRLAGEVERLHIDVPEVVSCAVDRILLVGKDSECLNQLAQALTVHSPLDDAFSIIREKLAHRRGPELDESKIFIRTSLSAAQAIKAAESDSFSCIISESRLSDMTGAELLQQFLDKHPDCVRLLVCENNSDDAIVDAVGAAHIFGVICKPCFGIEVKACVAQALNWRRMNIEKKVLAEIVRTVRTY